MKYFEIPTQVKFYDADTKQYIGGIAYRDEVICGCCGGIFSIEELYENCPEGFSPIDIYGNWVPLDKEICGE